MSVGIPEIEARAPERPTDFALDGDVVAQKVRAPAVDIVGTDRKTKEASGFWGCGTALAIPGRRFTSSDCRFGLSTPGILMLSQSGPDMTGVGRVTMPGRVFGHFSSD